ncbi:MAG: glycosyltransferase, partial [Elusimicrobiota bacterium]|nr:glycosyltransferase [Elusimicrobiota bacterium]
MLSQIDGGIKDKIEICISDDASLDNTKQLIEQYQKQRQIKMRKRRKTINENNAKSQTHIGLF